MPAHTDCNNTSSASMRVGPTQVTIWIHGQPNDSTIDADDSGDAIATSRTRCSSVEDTKTLMLQHHTCTSHQTIYKTNLKVSIT